MRRWRENLPAKLMALVAALFLWVFVMKEQNPTVENTYIVPVHVKNLSQQYVVNGAPQEVKVVLRGPRNSLMFLNQSALHAYLDLNGAQVGTQTVNIEFNPPAGIVLDSMTPSSATIQVDEYAVKEIAVELRQVGKLPKHISLKDVNMLPKVVSVSGPKKTVDAVEHVYLPIRMEEQSGDFTGTGTLLATDTNGNALEVTITPYQGQAKIDLEKIAGDKKLIVTPMVTGSVAPGYVVKGVTVQPTTVVINGKDTILNSFNDLKTSEISVANLDKSLDGEYELLVPEGTTVAPSKVHVHVEIVKKTDNDKNN